MPKFICEKCTVSKDSEIEYNKHMAICESLSSSPKDRIRQRDTDKYPQSIDDIFKIVLALREENQSLRKRIEKLESVNNIIKKRTIEEYLLSLPKQDYISFQEWLSSIKVTDLHLNIIIEKDLTECLRQILIDSIDSLDNKIPLKIFAQRNKQFYKFENSLWVHFSCDDLKTFITILEQRIMRKYIEWKIKNKEEIDENPQMQELNLQYMFKTNGGGKPIESRISVIRKALFDKIKENMSHLT
jgi:uncharacterized protein YneF (UPF0154 family)